MQDFFVSNPWMEIIYINNMKISTLRTSSGSQNNPKYKIISEVIENDIFKLNKNKKSFISCSHQ